MYHEKSGPIKTKQARWTQTFSRGKKRRATYVSNTKEKERKKEESDYFRSLNDLSNQCQIFFGMIGRDYIE